LLEFLITLALSTKEVLTSDIVALKKSQKVIPVARCSKYVSIGLLKITPYNGPTANIITATVPVTHNGPKKVLLYLFLISKYPNFNQYLQ
jgi:hypothetical protein